MLYCLALAPLKELSHFTSDRSYSSHLVISCFPECRMLRHVVFPRALPWSLQYSLEWFRYPYTQISTLENKRSVVCSSDVLTFARPGGHDRMQCLHVPPCASIKCKTLSVLQVGVPWVLNLAFSNCPRCVLCTLGFSRNATKVCIATWLSHDFLVCLGFEHLATAAAGKFT